MPGHQLVASSADRYAEKSSPDEPVRIRRVSEEEEYDRDHRPLPLRIDQADRRYPRRFTGADDAGGLLIPKGIGGDQANAEGSALEDRCVPLQPFLEILRVGDGGCSEFEALEVTLRIRLGADDEVRFQVGIVERWRLDSRPARASGSAADEIGR